MGQKGRTPFWEKIGSVLILVAVLLAAATASAEERSIELAGGETLRYRVVRDAADSAQPAALQILRHLSAGELEAAAALSNAPERRLEVLRDYRSRVGDDELRRVFQRYFHEGNRVLLEAALGPHRLLVWELGEAAGHLAGQYFVALDGRFLLDDVPSATRRDLERLLQALRKRHRG
jgi:hypothetical protein